MDSTIASAIKHSNLNEVKRAEQRFKDLQGQSSSVPVLKRKVGRPSLNMTSPDTIAEQPMLRRSQSEPYNKKLCVICQKDGGVLHMFQTLQMGANMLSVSEINSDKSFYRRLNSITAATDAPTNDVMYHNTCWIKAKREAEKTVEFVREDEYVKALSDVEIIHFVEKQLLDPNGNVLDMTIINDTYKSILHANGVSQENISSIITRSA